MKESVSMPGHLRVGLGPTMPAANEHILSQVRFSSGQHASASPQLWPLGLEHLHGPEQENWYVDEPVQNLETQGFVVHDSAHWSWLGYETACNDQTDFAVLAQDLFSRLNQACTSLNKTLVARTWVIIPDIHRGVGDAERYKQFCLGRHNAYQQLGLEPSHYPAATVIGSHDNMLRLHALVSTCPGRAVENPRQISAYRYPRKYGPRSPSFSRAMKLPNCTLVSGTAAIYGADSRHLDDTAAQLQEIRENLASLKNAAECHDDATPGYARLYLRNADELGIARNSAGNLWPQSANWPVLQADICRDNLRCEIETVFPT